MFLIANKTDLEEERVVFKEEGELFKQSNNLDYFDEVSALKSYKTKDVLINAAKCLYMEYVKLKKEMTSSAYSSTASRRSNKSIKIEYHTNNQQLRENNNSCNC